MTTNTAQELRFSALRWQLRALEAQAQVLANLGEEHTFPVQNVSVEDLHLQVRDLLTLILNRAESCAKDGSKPRSAEMIGWVASADLLRKQADDLLRMAGRLSRLHLETHPLRVHLPGEPQPDDTMEQRARASCYKAEDEQYRTFILQVQASLDLGLETLYMAAA